MNHKTAEQVRSTQERKRSGGYGTHGDRRLKRNKTRATQKRAAMKEFA